MARQINKTQPFQDKLVKLIPTEIVGAYMVLAGMLGFDPTSTGAAKVVEALGPSAKMAEVTAQIPEITLKPILIQVVFFVLLILTPIDLWKVSKVSSIVQIAVTTISFIIWGIYAWRSVRRMESLRAFNRVGGSCSLVGNNAACCHPS